MERFSFSNCNNTDPNKKKKKLRQLTLICCVVCRYFLKQLFLFSTLSVYNSITCVEVFTHQIEAQPIQILFIYTYTVSFLLQILFEVSR